MVIQLAPQILRFDFNQLRDFRNPNAPTIQHLRKPEPEQEEFVPVDTPPPAPTFSEAELEAAKHQAREEGRKAGINEGIEQSKKADTEREQALIAALQAAQAQLLTMHTQHTQMFEQKQQEMVGLALKIAEFVVGESLAATPAMLAKRLSEECLPYLLQEPNVTLAVHGDILPLLEAHLAQHPLHPHTILQADANLPRHDCRIMWQQGSAHTSLEALWQQVQDRLGVEKHIHTHIDNVAQHIQEPPHE